MGLVLMNKFKRLQELRESELNLGSSRGIAVEI
jgi:hypothetical protein